MIYQCIGERSDKPYMIRDTQTGIYSMEELLYYIRENVFMLNPDDFGAGLVRFMRKRLNLPEIASKYEEMLTDRSDFADRICMLFSELKFAGESEIGTLRKALNMRENMSNNDSHRVRGDFFFKSGRIPEAVIEYSAALKLINCEEDPEDAAKLLSNMGNAAARSFKFDRALEYFEEAFQLAPEDPELLNRLIAAAKLSMSDDAFSEYIKAKDIPEDIVNACTMRMKQAGDRALKRNDAHILREGRAAKGDGNYSEYVNLRKSILNDWKTRYRNSGV